MRRTRHVVLPVKSWQYMGLMMVSLACLTLGLVSRDRGGRSGSLAGPELEHTAPHEVDACPNLHPLTRMSLYDESALQKRSCKSLAHARTSEKRSLTIRLRDEKSTMLNHGKTFDQDSRSTIDPLIDARSLRTGSSMIRQRKMTVETRLSGINDRRTRDLTRSNERRVDRAARSRMIDAGSLAKRVGDQDRKRNGVSRSSARSASERDHHEDQSLRMSRSRHNRTQRETNERRSGERRSRTLNDQQKRTELFTKRSSERIGRKNLDQNTDAFEGRERSNILARSRDDRKSRSSIVDRQSNRFEDSGRRTNQLGHRSNQERQGRLEVRSRIFRSLERRLEEPRTFVSDRTGQRLWIDSLRSSVRNSRKEEATRLSPRNKRLDMRDISANRERSNVRDVSQELNKRLVTRNSRISSERAVGQELRTSSERRETSRVRELGQTPRIDSRRTIKISRNADSERQERLPTRDISRERRVHSAEGAIRQERRISNDRRETSGMRVFGQTFATDSMRRNIQNSRTSGIANPVRQRRLDTRDISQERRVHLAEGVIRRDRRISNDRGEASGVRVFGQTSTTDSMQRNIQNSRTSGIANLERQRRLDTRDISQERRVRLGEGATRRERRISNDRRETSGVRMFRQTSAADSMHRNIRNSRTSGIANSERQRLDTRDISQERRVRLAEGAIRRERRISNDRREASGVRVFGQTSTTNSMHQNIRNSRTSRSSNSEREGRLDTRDISRERRVRSAEDVIRQEVRISNERREISGARVFGRTSATDSIHRNIRNSRTSAIANSERLGRLETRDISQERRIRSADNAIRREVPISNERREVSRARVLGQTSATDSMRRNIRNSRTSTISNSERQGRLDTRDISQERRIRSTESAIRQDVRISNERREISGARMFGRTSATDSMRRNIRTSRTSTIANSERQGRLDTRDISQERRIRSVEDAITQEVRISNERREMSGARVLRQISATDSMRRNIRNSRTSTIANSERQGRLYTRDISQERRVRSAEDAIRREIRISNERRELSRARILGETSATDSMRRNIRNSRTSTITNSERQGHLETRGISQERRIRWTDGAIRQQVRISNKRREISGARVFGRTSATDSMRRNIRSSRTSAIANSESQGRLEARDISQERRVRSTERTIAHKKSDPIKIKSKNIVQNERINSRQELKPKNNEINSLSSQSNREIINKNIQMSLLANIPQLTNKIENHDYLRQVLVLVLCAIYGASLLKGKGGLYSFRDIINRANRLVMW